MRTALRGLAVLAVAALSSAPATTHHSEPLYFDLTKAITLEGLILRVEWINPHALIIKTGNTFFEPTGAVHSTFGSASENARAKVLAFMGVPTGTSGTAPA